MEKEKKENKAKKKIKKEALIRLFTHNWGLKLIALAATLLLGVLANTAP